MGWLNDRNPGHEGYIVGLVPDERQPERWRELGRAPLPNNVAEDKRGLRVERMKVACDCGWRSRVFSAGLKAEWFPSITELHDVELEKSALAEWQHHLVAEARRSTDERPYLGRLVPVETWT